MLDHVTIDGNARWGLTHNCIVNVWTGDLQANQLQELSRFIDQMVRQQRRKLALLILVAVRGKIPEQAVRKEADRFYENGASRFSAVAQVIEASGMMASTALSIATAFSLLTRRRYPCRAFRSTDDAIRWLVAHGDLGNEPPADLIASLQAGLDSLRAASEMYWEPPAHG